MQVKMLHNDVCQFTQPEFNFGQKVKTLEGDIGIVVGLDFYPETATWSYGIYPINRYGSIEELWYEADQLKALDKAKFPHVPRNA